MSFSVRMGLVQPREAIQLNSMDGALRTRLYNYLYSAFDDQWDDHDDGRFPGPGYYASESISLDFWMLPRDETRFRKHAFLESLKDFIFEVDWHLVYDLLEFILQQTSLGLNVESINLSLSRERAGYRVIDSIVIPISDPTELEAIAEVLEPADGFSGAREHIADALRKLSQKPEPDLRNAIKEGYRLSRARHAW